MIVQHEIERADHFDEMAGRTNVGRAGLWIAGRVVVRDHQTTRVEIERPPHGATQRQGCGTAMPPFVKILRDEQTLGSEIEHHHAFLAADAEAAHEVLAKSRTIRLGRLADQCLARSQYRQLTGHRNCGREYLMP